MPLSYRARLRRDLQLWEERGLIDAGQRARIAAEALAPRGLAYLQGALVLCLAILVAPAVIAFVAANWAGLQPLSRLIVLFLGNAAAILLAWLAADRHGRRPSGLGRVAADGAATLSLVFAGASLALVAQTFHLPPDTRGFAATMAMLGVATALVARSGSAALVASLALLVADLLPSEAGLDTASFGNVLAFSVVMPGLLVGCLSGWIPARSLNLLLLLVAIACRVGAIPASPLSLVFAPDRVLAVGVLALALGHMLARIPEGQRMTAWRDGGAALSGAAAGLCLVGIVAVAARSFGGGGFASVPSLVLSLAAFGVAAAIVVLPWRRSGVATPPADIVVLAAASAAWLALAFGLVAGKAWISSHVLTVWGGILPCLALVVAAQIEDRRALFGWSLTAAAALTIMMLAQSRNLLGFSANLIVCAALVATALAACRWAGRRQPAGAA